VRTPLWALLAAPLFTLSAQDSPCLDCHEVSVESSAHIDIVCEDCHTQVDIDAHLEDLEEDILPKFSQDEACGMCHEDEWDEHANSVHGLSLGNGFPDAATCVHCHGSHDVLPATDLKSLVHSANLVNTCGQCHANEEFIQRHDIAIVDPVRRYKQSIHFRVMEESAYTAATCNDCHGTHDIQNLRHSQSTINFWNVAETCGQCHTTEYEEFRTSDHWVALQRGVHDAPSCISCHGEHDITDPTERYDVASKRETADHTCVKCHSDQELARKYGLPTDVATTYRDSYHGLAVIKGDEDAAACFDCHGVHAILGKRHPASSIHPDNLQQACGQCHLDATKEFARTYTHASVLYKETPVEDLVGQIYFTLIVAVIGGMALHNGILLVGYIRRKKRERFHEQAYAVKRFSPNEVAQHGLMIVSFFTLVITGFALKFPSTWWVQLLGQIGLTEGARSLIHRSAAVIMITVSVWHVIYILASRWGRHHFRQMLPGYNDLLEAKSNIQSNLAGKQPKVAFGLFDYTEKAEYWALIWGTLIMIITGTILWFPMMFGEATPVWLIKVSEAVHYWEAWLATLAILVWHLFFTIFHPDDYPGSGVMFFSGRMDNETWRHKHGRFYEELERELAAFRSGDISFEKLSPFAQKVIHDLGDASPDDPSA